MSTAPEPAQPLDDEKVERAKRVREMLDRWAREDVRDEPEWDIADVEPVSLREPAIEPE